MTSAWHEGHILGGYQNPACQSCRGEQKRHPAPEQEIRETLEWARIVERLAALLHEARCGPYNLEHVPWTPDHHEWDVATAKALLLLGVRLTGNMDEPVCAEPCPVCVQEGRQLVGESGEPKETER